MKKENLVSVPFMVLGIVFCVCLVAANLLETKVVQLGPISVTAGLIVFPISYIINDCIAEVWGFRTNLSATRRARCTACRMTSSAPRTGCCAGFRAAFRLRRRPFPASSGASRCRSRGASVPSCAASCTLCTCRLRGCLTAHAAARRSSRPFLRCSSFPERTVSACTARARTSN